MIVIVDYKMGNLGSIKNMLKRIGSQSVISSDLEEIKNASKIILPGVGSFDRAINNINEMGIREELENSTIKRKVPTLGICLGMQIMTYGSEEGKLEGLKWIKGRCKKFIEKDLRIPHMGWNYTNVINENLLIKKNQDPSKFYFVHSYYVDLHSNKDIIFSTEYGENFCSGFNVDNIYGVQFHPEKSHKFGQNLLQNFIKI